MTILLLMSLTLIVLLAIGLPIGLVLGLSGIFWLVVRDPALLRGASYAIVNLSTGEVLVSMPLFILMGLVVQKTAVANRFYSGVAIWLRRLPGRLLHTNIAVCAVFSAVSGSSVATAATVASTALPNLMRLNYEKRLMSGTLAAGGTLGILIPPSIPLIIYGAAVQQSIGQLFVAAMLPAALMVALFTLYILVRGVLNPEFTPADISERITMSRRLRSLLDMAPLATIALVVIGGIYLGWTTTIEAAALGLAMAVVMAAATRSLSFAVLREALFETVDLTAMLLFILIGATLFSFAVFSWGINSMAAELIADITLPPLVVILLICAAYVVLGMFIDSISIMLMTVSVVVPAIVSLGYDPIWFGIVLVILLEVGLITPPVGMNLFTIQAMSPNKSITLGDVSRGSFPFVLLMLATVLILILFPEIVMWPLRG